MPAAPDRNCKAGSWRLKPVDDEITAALVSRQNGDPSRACRPIPPLFVIRMPDCVVIRKIITPVTPDQCAPLLTSVCAAQQICMFFRDFYRVQAKLHAFIAERRAGSRRMFHF